MNEWKSKKIAFLGDSITEGVGTNIGERYFDYLQKTFEFVPLGYGVNGANYFNVYNQAEKLFEEHGSNVDCIFVAAGTNDFNCSIPLGEFFSEEYAGVITLETEDGKPEIISRRKKRDFIFSSETFCGRINNVFAFLKHNYPETQIVACTPLHRAFAKFSRDNIQYNELYSNERGLYIEDYVETIRKAADVWSLNLIDLYRESGLFPLYDEYASRYFANFETDRLHPSANGHKRVAKTIEAHLKNILPLK